MRVDKFKKLHNAAQVDLLWQDDDTMFINPFNFTVSVELHTMGFEHRALTTLGKPSIKDSELAVFINEVVIKFLIENRLPVRLMSGSMGIRYSKFFATYRYR